MSVEHTLSFVLSVDRTKVGMTALEGLQCEVIANRQVVETMPREIAERVELVFSLPSKPSLSNIEAEQELSWDMRTAADPYTLLAFNRQYPDFCESYPHWTQWENDTGIWCVMVFRIDFLTRKRQVRIALNNCGWSHAGLLAGTPL